MSEQTLACKEWTKPVMAHIDLVEVWTGNMSGLFGACLTTRRMT